MYNRNAHQKCLNVKKISKQTRGIEMIQPLQNQQGTKGLQGFASCLENDLLFLINVEWLLIITFVDLLKI